MLDISVLEGLRGGRRCLPEGRREDQGAGEGSVHLEGGLRASAPAPPYDGVYARGVRGAEIGAERAKCPFPGPEVRP